MKNKWQLGKGQFPEEMWMTQISSIPPGKRETQFRKNIFSSSTWQR